MIARSPNRLIAWRELAIAACLLLSLNFSLAASAKTGSIYPRDPLMLNMARLTNRIEVVQSPLFPSKASIGPGSYLIITNPDGSFVCTAGFIFKDASAQYLSTAGHCLLTTGATATAGPGADYNPDNSSVEVCIYNCIFGGELEAHVQGTFAQLGRVAYARQSPDATSWDDFGLITIPSSLNSLIRPSLPFWGGPTSEGVAATGSPACFYGNGEGPGYVSPTKARLGALLSEDDGAGIWNAAIAVAPGDSGSAVETCALASNGVSGQIALGTLTYAGTSGATGTLLEKSIDMARQAGLSISLVENAAAN